MTKYLGKKDWFIAGLDILEEYGSMKITIENLCCNLGVTKGSFYHHFEHIDGYIASLMDFWLEENTLRIIRQADESDSEKPHVLKSLVSCLRHNAELHIRVWSFSNAIVREFVTKADQIRLNYLTDILIQMGHDRSTATDEALIEYATLIGVQQLCSEMSANEWNRLQEKYSKIR